MSRTGVNLAEKKIDPMTIRVMLLDSPVWVNYKKMNESLTSKINGLLAESLSDPTVSRQDLIDGLTEVVGVSERRARTIARTETNVIRNKGRELGFKVVDPNNEYRFKWGGPYDNRTSDACGWVKRNTPKAGLSLDDLNKLVKEAVRKFYPKLTPRDWSVHPNCRHFPQKVVRYAR